MTLRVFAACFAATLVAACGTTRPEPEVRTVEVRVPVPVSCVPAGATIEPRFKVSRGDVIAAPDSAERLRLTAAGFLERDAYANEAAAVLRGCRD